MPVSSNSVSSTSLPLGADNHTTLSRSGSVPRSVHHEHRPAVYDQDPQTYSDLIADAQHSVILTRLPNVRIPPSSIKSIPRSHKKVLREHRILFRVLIVIFLVSLIALTAAVVLGAFTAHLHGQNGVKCAATIVGVFGFSGAVGSGAVIWLILTGRKERARLEKRWADEERVKEAISMRGRRTESQLRGLIKDRERSLSRSRSRGRDRERVARPAGARIRSFRSFEATTPTPTSFSRMPDHGAQPRSRRARSPWPRAGDVIDDVDNDSDNDLDKEDDKEKNYEKEDLYNGAGGNRKDEERDDEKDYTHHDNLENEDEVERDYEKDGISNNNRDRDKNHGNHEEEGTALATQNMRDSASTQFQDLDPMDSEDDDDTRTETASRPNTAMLQPKVLPKVSPPIDIFKALPAIPDSGYASPIPRTINPTYVSSSVSDLYSGALEPFHSSRNPLIQQTPVDTDILRSNRVETGNARGDNSSPPDVIRWTNGGLGSTQSDENFEAMLELADDAGSEDERDRQLRRQKGQARVDQWASAVSLAAGGAEREEKGKKLKEALQKGIRRVASKKKEWRKETVGYV